MSADAPDGVQSAFIEGNGSLWQTFTLSSGVHSFSFQAAQVVSVNESSQQVRVTLLGLPTSTKTFVWSENTIAEERDASGMNVTKRFFAEGEQRFGGGDAGNYYYSRDHLGSVREVTDASGVVKAQYDYDAWGNQVVVTGNMSFDFGYTGHYRHAASNLYLAKYRSYDPTMARWINRDPIAEQDGTNLYAYVGADPINRVDVDGLRSEGFSSAPEAARAGAMADLMAASGGKLVRGAIEYAGWVCKCNCGGAKPYYYTGPTRGHKGPTPDGRPVSTYSNPNEFEPCAQGDDKVGMHYAHPDGTGIPVEDQQVSNARQRPFMLARPVNGPLPGIKIDPYGSWR